MRLAEGIFRQQNVRYGFAALFAFSAVAAVVGLSVTDGSILARVGLPVLIGLSAVGIALAPTETMDERWLHALPLLIVGETGLSMIATLPDPAPPSAILTFLGPATAFLFTTWRAIAPHLLVATLAAIAILVLGGATTTSSLTVATVLFVMWGLAASTMTIWRHAERVARELDRLTRTDPVTGVGNRRMLDDRLAYEIVRHTRSRQPLTLVILDLNGFKAINDTLGHAAGDDLLRAAAHRLQTAVRAQDSVTRAGGDEFAVVAPATPREAAPALAKTLREALGTIDAGGERLSAAIGVAVFPDDGRDARSLYEAADAAQRQDKPDQRVR